MADVATLNLTEVLVALIAAVPAIIAAVFAGLVAYRVKTPSGDRIGAVAERTHDLSAADLATTQSVKETVDRELGNSSRESGAVESGEHGD